VPQRRLKPDKLSGFDAQEEADGQPWQRIIEKARGRSYLGEGGKVGKLAGIGSSFDGWTTIGGRKSPINL
jgi:hypothetical protein